MKTFETNWKINFVDKNNVLVGFDYSSSCCESFGWMISPGLPTDDDLSENADKPDTEGYVFDTTFKAEERSGGDEGGKVSFRLTKGEDVLYLTLWNHHNGYYSHGFEMTLNANEIFSGSL